MLSVRRMRLLPKNQDWTGYVWLVYLVYFLIIPFLSAMQPWVRVASVLGALAALPLYFWGYWLSGRRVLWVVAGFVLLGIVFAPINPGAATMFVFAGTYLSGMGEPWKAFQYLVVILAIVGLEAWLAHLPPGFWLPTVFCTSLISSVVIQFVHRRRLTDKLLAAQAESEHLAKIAEREIFLKGELSAAAAKGDAEAFAQIEKQLTGARKTLQAELEEKKEKARKAS